MKFILVVSLLALSVSCNAGTTSSSKTLPVNKDIVAIKAEEKKEADCDKKAIEIVEFKEESISLTGNTGCSLDEVKQ